MEIKNLLSEDYILLDADLANQNEAFMKISKLAYNNKLITNINLLLEKFKWREQQGSTGFEDGIAIPHAQSDDIQKPAIFILRTKNAIDWNSADSKPTNLIIAILLPEKEVAKLHLDIISKISTKLIDTNIREKLKKLNDKKEIINLLAENLNNNNAFNENKLIKQSSNIIGITSCTSGVVHTYLCKELLENAGKNLGYKVSIECQGQKGPEYVLSNVDIKEADLVILATDVAVDLDRFNNKKVYQCGTRDVVKDAKGVILKAIKNAKKETINSAGDFIISSAGNRRGILKHLLSGVSFMIPFVVFAGLVFAIDTGIAKAIFGTKFAFKSDWASQKEFAINELKIMPTNLMYVLMLINNIANIGFTFMIPVMGAYIAYSVAGRPGIAPAMIVTFILVSPPSNSGGIEMWWSWGNIFNLHGDSTIDATKPFLHNANISWTLFGAIYGGLVCGYLVKYVNSWEVPKWLAPIMPIIIIPLFCTAVVAIPTAFFIAAPFGYVMGALNYGLSWMGLPQNKGFGFLIGLILGAMVGFDMGGPINKTAVLVATSLMVMDGGRLMGPVAAAIPIAPLGCALTSTLIGRKLFTKQEQSLGWNAWLLGFMGISESAIPFAARNTWRTIIANVIGSAVAGALAFSFGVQGHVGAWGSFIIALFGGVTDTNGSYIGILWYFAAISIGTVVQSLIYTSFLYSEAGNFDKVVAKLFKNFNFSRKPKTNKVIIE